MNNFRIASGFVVLLLPVVFRFGGIAAGRLFRLVSNIKVLQRDFPLITEGWAVPFHNIQLKIKNQKYLLI